MLLRVYQETSVENVKRSMRFRKQSFIKFLNMYRIQKGEKVITVKTKLIICIFRRSEMLSCTVCTILLSFYVIHKKPIIIISNKHFNIIFGYPLSDTCCTCNHFMTELKVLQRKLNIKNDTSA